MNRILGAIGMLVVSVLFGFALAGVEPYPHSHDLPVLVISCLSFLVVAFLLRGPLPRRAWAIFGLVTFGLFFLIHQWYWYGVTNRGWWYPPVPPIIEQFVHVDGEAGYDAEVSNVFLVVWFCTSCGLAIHYFVRRARRRAALAMAKTGTEQWLPR